MRPRYSEISQTSQNVKPRSKWWRPNRKPVPGRYKPRPPSTARELMMEYLKSDAFEASIQAEKARARVVARFAGPRALRSCASRPLQPVTAMSLAA